jgi:hypothetical protein
MLCVATNADVYLNTITGIEVNELTPDCFRY